MSKQAVSEFLELIESESKKKLKVQVTSFAKPVFITPSSFKQQRSLVTTSLNGLVGVMAFIKSLNETILFIDDAELRIYDRVPIILALRKNISDKKLKVGELEVSVDELMKNYVPFTGESKKVVSGVGFDVNLYVPTLKDENVAISICIEDLKKGDTENLGKNVEMILAYEVPKFIESIKFGDNVITMKELTISERTKIMDNLPASVTGEITDFILTVREYDEKLLSFMGTVVDIDSSFFE